MRRGEVSRVPEAPAVLVTGGASGIGRARAERFAMAKHAWFLAQPAARSITGAALPIDNGLSAGTC